MSNQDIPKDYDFKKEKVWEQKWEDENIYKYIGDGSRPRYIIDTPRHTQQVPFTWDTS